MTIFVDASALVSIMTREPDCERLQDVLDHAALLYKGDDFSHTDLA